MVNARDDLRGPQRYHLQVAPTSPDDVAPGVLISNFARVRGDLDGSGIDVLDLYRFNVTANSRLFLKLQARRRSAFDLLLIDPLGNKLRCACGGSGDQSIVKDLPRGNYYVGVRARHQTRGGYRLLRASRTITHTGLTLAAATLDPHTAQQFSISVSPVVTGPVSIVLESSTRSRAGSTCARCGRRRSAARPRSRSWPPASVTSGPAPVTAGLRTAPRATRRSSSSSSATRTSARPGPGPGHGSRRGASPSPRRRTPRAPPRPAWPGAGSRSRPSGRSAG